jgi:hypothetical protein
MFLDWHLPNQKDLAEVVAVVKLSLNLTLALLETLLEVLKKKISKNFSVIPIILKSGYHLVKDSLLLLLNQMKEQQKLWLI